MAPPPPELELRRVLGLRLRGEGREQQEAGGDPVRALDGDLQRALAPPAAVDRRQPALAFRQHEGATEEAVAAQLERTAFPVQRPATAQQVRLEAPRRLPAVVAGLDDAREQAATTDLPAAAGRLSGGGAT